jgi:hypothetical protein
MNHLEQLIAEWYEYQGYYVRRNVLVGKRLKGGYECELDIVAFHPEKKELLHIEPSLDADSWETRERRYGKKFLAGRKYIRKLFNGLDLPAEIKQQVVLVFASKANHTEVAGGKVVLIEEVLADIARELQTKKINSQAIPEQYASLRTIQFVVHYQEAIFGKPSASAEGPKDAKPVVAGSARMGYVNKHGQKNLGRRQPPLAGTDHGQFVYVLNCTACGFVYGANGSDIHLRKCPNCQKGRPGLALSPDAQR